MSKFSCLIIHTYVVIEFYDNTLNVIPHEHKTITIFFSEQVIGLS